MTTPMEKKTRTVKALAAPQRDAVLAALPGTIKQISERTGISIDAVWHHIYHLADKWLVERDGRVPAPAPGAPFRTCLMFCRAGERKTKDKPKVASDPLVIGEAAHHAGHNALQSAADAIRKGE